MYVNPFLPYVAFLYPLKRLENLWFSNLFRGSGRSIGGIGLNYIFIGFKFHDFNIHFKYFLSDFFDIFSGLYVFRFVNF